MASGKTNEIPQRRVSPAIGYQTEKHRTCGAFFTIKSTSFGEVQQLLCQKNGKKEY